MYKLDQFLPYKFYSTIVKTILKSGNFREKILVKLKIILWTFEFISIYIQ